jgi:hypothetical protein
MNDKTTAVSIRERLANTSGQALEYCWVQHPALGSPFVAQGTRITVPADTVVMDKPEPRGRLKAETTYKWPNVEDKKGNKIDLSFLPPDNVVADETAFITNIKEPWYAVVNPDLKLGFGLRWDLSVFPGLWFWQSYRMPDHPRFGKAYCIALEPCSRHLTAYEQLKRGTIKKLQGNASIETRLVATVFAGIEKVKAIDADGSVMQS